MSSHLLGGWWGRHIGDGEKLSSSLVDGLVKSRAPQHLRSVIFSGFFVKKCTEVEKGCFEQIIFQETMIYSREMQH